MKRHPNKETIRRAFSSDEAVNIFDRACALGWTYRVTGTNHLLIVAPDGNMAISMSMSQNAGGRRMQNYWARLKRWEKNHGPDRR